MKINTAHIQAIAAEVRDILGDDFDGETFWDTLDGEADALDIADKLLTDRAETLAHADALKAMIADLTARQKRMESRARRYADTLGVLLAATGERKLERPMATVSIRAGTMKPQITDEALIPSQLMRVKTTREPDLLAIGAQLKAGEDVPGATLVKGADGVAIRTK